MTLGDRMKHNYEDRYRIKLTRRMPVIMRLDGRAFHTFTKRVCEKPFDDVFMESMIEVTKYLCKDIQGAKLAYIQSDEISILITDYDKLNTEAWFDYNIQKMCSVSAGMASAMFNSFWRGVCDEKSLQCFDSRVFNIPREEVCNYFIWRQQDWVKNSIQMFARQFFSHRQLDKKTTSDVHEMLYALVDRNWAGLKEEWKNGVMINKTSKGTIVLSAPIFTKNREVIENLLTESDETKGEDDD